MKDVCKGITEMTEEAASCCATKGVAGVECEEVRLVGNANQDTGPLILMEGNDPIGLGYVMNSSL